MTITTSVLMSVYHRVKAAELKQCLASLTWQSRQPDQIVIVIDGEIGEDLSSLLENFQSNHSIPVDLVPLAQNQGLSRALNAGLKACQGDWIFRMDTDDIALPNRFASQLEFLEQNPDIDVLGTALYEFSDNPNKPDRVKPVIEQHSDIASSFGLRNPINHPTVLLRKSKLEQVGGYPELNLTEDYYLWAKLLAAGATFHNLPTPLYLFRFDTGTLSRRRGKDNFRNETWLRRWMREQGLISFSTATIAAAIQVVLRFSPPGVQRWLWHKSRQPVDVELALPD